MTAVEAETLLGTVRRHFRLAWLIRTALLILAVGACVGAFLPDGGEQREELMSSALLLVGVSWMLLMVISVRQIRRANQASVYIASGRLDLAEQQLKGALGAFSLYRRGKLLICHNLAVVAHGKKDYDTAAALCDGVLSMRKALSRNVDRLCRILLADSRLFLGDAESAAAALEPLSAGDGGLGLSTRLMLLPVELRCQTLLGAFSEAVSSLRVKVKLAELLDSAKAALVHALLARACRETGQDAAADFLLRRAWLYHDLGELAEDYPFLRDSAPGTPSADNNTDSAA
ncbi:MAG: hypothetical protein ABII12_08790 [Planctomycetota bacterium]